MRYQKKKKIIILKGLNARIDNEAISKIKQRFNEEDHNDNGDLLIDFCTYNSLSVNNTFFDHKTQPKYTFENIQGRRSMIDYSLTNREFNPSQIIDVRALDTPDIGSYHKMVMCKIKLILGKRKNQNTNTKIRIRVEGDLTEEIDTTTEIRQGHFLSPMFFNLIMDKVIDRIKPLSDQVRR